MRIRLNTRRLLELISASRISQNHWALRLGLSRGHWSNIVQGKHPYPSGKTRERLLEAFNVTFDELFAYETTSGAHASFQAAIADRYLIDREIGQGGMGTVYLARDVKLARPVAIKVVSEEAVSGIGADQFLREIRFTSRLRHHHILPLYDAGEAEGFPYYVMPALQEGSLRNLINPGRPLPVDQVLELVRGIAKALQHAHDRQVLHCDIKPENILISENHAYVADFGIARAIHAEALEWGKRGEIDSSAGTPAYVSPEQAAGETNLDTRSDIYSLACMVFEMLSGDAPFHGRGTMEIVAQRFVESPSLGQRAPHLPPDVTAVIGRGMSLDRSDRQESVSVFASELAAGATRSARRASRVLLTASHLATSIRYRLRTSRLPQGNRHMDQWKLDLRYAFRMLRNNPLLTIVTVVTLALGIGANTAIFSAVNGVLLEPLPFPQSDRVVVIREVDTGGSQLQVSPPNFLDWRDRQRSFSALSFSQFYGWQTVIGGVTPVRAIVERVGRDFFSLFGVAPTLGRGFSPDENTVGGPAAMIVSHSFWENQLSADSSLDRHVLNVGGESYAVIGVMPPDFRFQAEPDIWLPAERFQLSTGRTSHQLRVVGRLLDDHTVLDAYQDLQAILADIRLTVPQVSPNVSMQTMKEEITGGTRRSLLVLMGAASLLLLIACTNVASTLLARGELRHREFVMRAAMGAGRGRLVRQLLTESGLLAVLGAAVGLGVAVMLVQIIHKLASSNITRIDNVVVDLSVLTFSGAATLLTVLTFGLWPAIRASRHETTTVLRSGTSGATKQQRASWFALVTVEIAIAFALVIGSTLMIRSFWNITRVEKGFEPANLLTMDYALPESKYSEEMVPGFHDRFLADIRSLPGVTAAGLVNHLPLTGNGMFAGVKRIEAADGVRGDYRLASPGFFEAMGIQMIRGRGFQTGDGPGSIHTTVVNERLADLLWPNEDALGKQILLSGNDRHYETPLEVVGVAPTIRHRRLTALEPPTYYVNYRQRPMQSRKVVAVIRTSGPPETLIPMIRDRLHSFDRDIPAEFANMTTRVSASVINERFTMTILAGFTFIALTLAAVGVFGVVSYAVARRTREIGIRLALGAIPTAVRNMILRQSLTMVVAGAVSGTILALYLMRFIRGVLFDVDSVGLPFLLTAAAVLGVTAILATWIPARRGMRVDPITAVRSEA